MFARIGTWQGSPKAPPPPAGARWRDVCSPRSGMESAGASVPAGQKGKVEEGQEAVDGEEGTAGGEQQAEAEDGA